METDVLIIGGGITGCGLARDLALRGVRCILVEQNDINAGASGANHGLLHSGARYVLSNPDDAIDCMHEGRLLKRLAANCIEETGGLYVAVEGDDDRYIADFPGRCARCGIPVQKIDVRDALEMEPALSSQTIAVFQVDDAAIDPFKLSMENINQARQRGCRLLRHTKVIGFVRHGHAIRKTRLLNQLTGSEFSIRAKQVVIAAGAWSGMLARLAGAPIGMIGSKGSLVITNRRLTHRVINLLRPPANGDILVPGGTVSILGTTSIRIENPDEIYPTVTEIDDIVGDVGAMLPGIEKTRLIRAYAGVRPLIQSSPDGDDRHISRGIALFDHAATDPDNLVTITGGKLTTYRLMAEKAADLVCARLGIDRPCRTRSVPLPSSAGARWTRPGLSSKRWLHHRSKDDFMICECEMVPRNTVDAIVESIHEQNGQPDLMSIGLRSRIGKGACQGTTCGFNLTAYLYETGELTGEKGIDSLRAFLRERWRGVRPLLWGTPLCQSELLEAIYCGLNGLEL